LRWRWPRRFFELELVGPDRIVGAPPALFDECGVDPTDGTLACEIFEGC
jgi:hypothetical protein